MFITPDEVYQRTGLYPRPEILGIAQSQVETHVGRFEEEVTDPHDLLLLGRATLFQAVYLEQRRQKASKPIVKEDTEGNQVSADEEQGPSVLTSWAAKACAKVSWLRGRTVVTGSLHDRTADSDWATE